MSAPADAIASGDEVQDVALFVAANVAAFAFASLFFSYFIFRDYEVKNYGVQVRFRGALRIMAVQGGPQPTGAQRRRRSRSSLPSAWTRSCLSSLRSWT